MALINIVHYSIVHLMHLMLSLQLGLTNSSHPSKQHKAQQLLLELMQFSLSFLFLYFDKKQKIEVSGGMAPALIGELSQLQCGYFVTFLSYLLMNHDAVMKAFLLPSCSQEENLSLETFLNEVRLNKRADLERFFIALGTSLAIMQRLIAMSPPLTISENDQKCLI